LIFNRAGLKRRILIASMFGLNFICIFFATTLYSAFPRCIGRCVL